MDNFDSFIEKPSALFEIVDEVANGGSLITFCKQEKLRYSKVINWIYEDEGKQKSYEKALEARGEWVAQRLLAELQKVSFVNVKDLFDDDGSIKDVSDLDDDVAAAIGGIDIQEEVNDKDGNEIVPRTRKIKLIDKLKSIELLGKNLKMFTDKVEHSGGMSLEKLVEGSMKPEEETPEKPETVADDKGVTTEDIKNAKDKVDGQEDKSEPQETEAEEVDDGI